VLFLLVAPVMKFYMQDGAGHQKTFTTGETMRGREVGEVIESKHPDFQAADIVQGKCGWQEYVIFDGNPYYMMYKVQQCGLSYSTTLGV